MEIFLAFIAGAVAAVLVLLITLKLRRRRLRPPYIEQTRAKQNSVERRVRRIRDATASKGSFARRMRELTLRDEYRALAEEKAAIESDLLKRPDVVGVAIGQRDAGHASAGEPVIRVFVKDDSVDLGPLVRDHPIEIVRTGRITAGGAEPPFPPELAIQPIQIQLQARVRPVVGGVSISHFQTNYGTLATCCFNAADLPSKPDMYYMLSANHVLANCNNGNTDDFDPILQPGRPVGSGSDTSSINDEHLIGWLTAYVPIEFPALGDTTLPCNLADAAIAVGHFKDLSKEIYWTGHVLGCDYKPKVGDVVQKTGANSAFTVGRITGVDATVKIDYSKYGHGETQFCHQIAIEELSSPGDSGSLIVNSNTRRAVGLLFAQSGTKKESYANPILFVEDLLEIRLCEDGKPRSTIDDYLDSLDAGQTNGGNGDG